jgi:hypothetical protein
MLKTKGSSIAAFVITWYNSMLLIFKKYHTKINKKNKATE